MLYEEPHCVSYMCLLLCWPLHTGLLHYLKVHNNFCNWCIYIYIFIHIFTHKYIHIHTYMCASHQKHSKNSLLSARLYTFTRGKQLERFISAKGLSILMTEDIWTVYLGVISCVIFSQRGVGRWWPLHPACFWGRKLLSSQKHERNRMYKGVISWVEEEIRTSIHPKTV